jgi:hypothetical protein
MDPYSSPLVLFDEHEGADQRDMIAGKLAIRQGNLFGQFGFFWEPLLVDYLELGKVIENIVDFTLEVPCVVGVFAIVIAEDIGKLHGVGSDFIVLVDHFLEVC